MTKIVLDYALSNPTIDSDDPNKNARALPAALMNFNYLTGYLQNVALSGFDNPLTAVQSGTVFENLERSHSTNAVKIEQFATWYKMDEEKVLRADLKNKRVFAYLLEELSHKDEILDGGVDGGTTLIKGGEAKNIMIKLKLLEPKKWEKLEKEMNKSKMNDLNTKNAANESTIGATVKNISPRQGGSGFNVVPLDKAKAALTNLTGNLTGFMRKMSMKRKGKSEEGKDDQKDIDKIDADQYNDKHNADLLRLQQLEFDREDEEEEEEESEQDTLENSIKGYGDNSARTVAEFESGKIPLNRSQKNKSNSSQGSRSSSIGLSDINIINNSRSEKYDKFEGKMKSRRGPRSGLGSGSGSQNSSLIDAILGSQIGNEGAVSAFDRDRNRSNNSGVRDGQRGDLTDRNLGESNGTGIGSGGSGSDDESEFSEASSEHDSSDDYNDYDDATASEDGDNDNERNGEGIGRNNGDVDSDKSVNDKEKDNDNNNESENENSDDSASEWDGSFDEASDNESDSEEESGGEGDNDDDDDDDDENSSDVDGPKSKAELNDPTRSI